MLGCRYLSFGAVAAAIIITYLAWSSVLVSEDTLCFSVSMWPVEGDMQSLSLHISCIIDKCAEKTHKALCLGLLDAEASQAPSCRGARPGFNLPISEAQNLHGTKVITALWIKLEISLERVENALNTQIRLFLLRCRFSFFSLFRPALVSIVALFGLLLGPWTHPLLWVPPPPHQSDGGGMHLSV